MGLLSAEQVEKIAVLPISPELPAGDSVRLEPSFERIENELSKLDDFTSREPVRWDDVAQAAQQILSNESKDLLVACYLTRSLCEVDFLEGLNQGLYLTKAMAEQFWDQAHPPKKRARGRAQAFTWLVEKCRPMLESYQPKEPEVEALQRAETCLAELDDLLQEKMADQAPHLLEFQQKIHRKREGLEQKLKQQGAPAPDSKKESPSIEPARPSHTGPSQPAQTAVASTTGLQGGVNSDRDLLAVYRTAREQLQAASQFLLSVDIKDPEAYRINRLITWLGVNQMPPAQAGRSQLQPMAKDRLDHFTNLYQQQKWAELIVALELSLVRAPFWLDGQKMAVDALEQLGCEQGIEQIESAVKVLLRRIPQIGKGCFSDGSPFASEATQQWLSRVTSEKAPQPNQIQGLDLESGSVSEEWEQSYDKAMTLASEKKMREALALFQGGANRAQSKREQTLWQFNQARFCVQHSLIQLALPLLHSIEQTLMGNGAFDCEPQVSKKVIGLLIECYQSQDQSEENQRQLKQLHGRLCQLDLAMAFDFKQLN